MGNVLWRADDGFACLPPERKVLLNCGREYQEVARDYVDIGSGACPTAMGNVLLLRGGKWLYAIGKK